MEKRNSLVTGLIAGAAMGVVAGLLLAPQSGNISRRFMATQARQTTGRYMSTLRRTMRRGQETNGSSEDNLITAG